MSSCPLCRSEANVNTDSSVAEVRCRSCGEFRLATDVGPDQLHVTKSPHKVSAFIRSQNLSGHNPLLTRTVVGEILAQPEKTIGEKSRLLLELFAQRTEYYRSSVTLDPIADYPLINAKNQQEFLALVELQHDLQRVVMTPTSKAYDVSLLAKGYEDLAVMAQPNDRSEKAFVAMSFDSNKEFTPCLTQTYLSAIEPAIESAGYRSVRVDMEEHNDYIMDKVLSEIRAARFVVAEFSQHRNGVYYEAAFARGLGLPVISVCHESEMSGAHFDTKQLNHIVWSSCDELKERLTKRIEATIGRGPLHRS